MSVLQIFNQIIIIFLLMLLGAVIRKVGFLKDQTVSDLTNIVVLVLSPAITIRVFEQPFSMEGLHAFLLCVVSIFISYALMVFLASVLFHRVKDPHLKQVAKFGSIYCNNGFMGIPLAQGLFGPVGVFYAVPSMIGFNCMIWTRGISLFRNKEKDQISTGKR